MKPLIHESVAEEKVAKRRTNSKSTMLSVKILNVVDWTQTVSIQKPESLPDSVVWNIDCEKASVLKDLWTGRVEEVPVCGRRSCKRTVVMSCEMLPETVSGNIVYRQCASSQQNAARCGTGSHEWDSGCCHRGKCAVNVTGARWSQCRRWFQTGEASG